MLSNGGDPNTEEELPRDKDTDNYKSHGGQVNEQLNSEWNQENYQENEVQTGPDLSMKDLISIESLTPNFKSLKDSPQRLSQPNIIPTNLKEALEPEMAEFHEQFYWKLSLEEGDVDQLMADY